MVNLTTWLIVETIYIIVDPNQISSHEQFDLLFTLVCLSEFLDSGCVWLFSLNMVCKEIKDIFKRSTRYNARFLLFSGAQQMQPVRLMPWLVPLSVTQTRSFRKYCQKLKQNSRWTKVCISYLPTIQPALQLDHPIKALEINNQNLQINWHLDYKLPRLVGIQHGLLLVEWWVLPFRCGVDLPLRVLCHQEGVINPMQILYRFLLQVQALMGTC